MVQENQKLNRNVSSLEEQNKSLEARLAVVERKIQGEGMNNQLARTDSHVRLQEENRELKAKVSVLNEALQVKEEKLKAKEEELKKSVSLEETVAQLAAQVAQIKATSVPTTNSALHQSSLGNN